MKLGRSISKACLVFSAMATYGLAISYGGHAWIPSNEDNQFCRNGTKVVRQGFAARFITNAPSYNSGESAVFRIDNIGTMPIGLIGEVFYLERFVNGRWRVDPESPRGFSRIRLGILRSGKSGFCKVFPVPTDLPAGYYRFRKEVIAGTSHKRKRLTAKFMVTSPAYKS